MQWLALCAATRSSVSLFSGIVDTGEVRQTDMLGTKIPVTHFGECFVVIVVRDVT